MEITVTVPFGPEREAVFGPAERNLKMIRESIGVGVTARGGVVVIRGEPENVATAEGVLSRLGAERRGGLSRRQVLDVIAEEMSRSESRGEMGNGASVAWDGRLDVYSRGRPIRPQTPNQEAYVQAIRDHDIVIAIGPAGTGKTYLSVAAAVHLLKTGRVAKVFLVRPAVEAGEKLGYLPGDVEAKVNPYLRPLYDALHDMMDFATIRRFMENDVVEVAPLAFMRGRTLNNAVIILDEAQNTTRAQMKMFLTRLGHGSKMIVTGDVTQIDIEDPRESGLIDSARRLRRTPGVAFVHLDRADVVRHPLVQRVIDAYGGEGRRGAGGVGRGAAVEAGEEERA